MKTGRYTNILQSVPTSTVPLPEISQKTWNSQCCGSQFDPQRQVINNPAIDEIKSKDHSFSLTQNNYLNFHILRPIRGQIFTNIFLSGQIAQFCIRHLVNIRELLVLGYGHFMSP